MATGATDPTGGAYSAIAGLRREGKEKGEEGTREWGKGGERRGEEIREG